MLTVEADFFGCLAITKASICLVVIDLSGMSPTIDRNLFRAPEYPSAVAAVTFD